MDWPGGSGIEDCHTRHAGRDQSSRRNSHGKPHKLWAGRTCPRAQAPRSRRLPARSVPPSAASRRTHAPPRAARRRPDRHSRSYIRFWLVSSVLLSKKAFVFSTSDFLKHPHNTVSAGVLRTALGGCKARVSLKPGPGPGPEKQGGVSGGAREGSDGTQRSRHRLATMAVRQCARLNQHAALPRAGLSARERVDGKLTPEWSICRGPPAPG